MTRATEFASKKFDYRAEDRFFSDSVEVLASGDFLADDLPLWVAGYPQVFKGRRVLEIGASEGVMGVFVAERCEPDLYVASDIIHRRMVGAARHARDLTNLGIVAANAFALPHRDSTFDIVVNNGALCHMPGLDDVASEIARVLRPGGEYIGREPNCHNPLVRRKTLYGPWASPNMVPVYERDLRRSFGRAGFDVEVSFFWRRSGLVRGKFTAVSMRIHAVLADRR